MRASVIEVAGLGLKKGCRGIGIAGKRHGLKSLLIGFGSWIGPTCVSGTSILVVMRCPELAACWRLKGRYERVF